MINILYCGNYKVFDGMLTCSLSILKRSKLSEPINFYIFTMNVSHLREDYLPVTEGQLKFFNEVIKSYNEDNNAILVDVTDLYKSEFTGCPNESAYCSPYTLIRLLADKIEGIPDKLLYLDCDLMFNRDIHLLYDLDVSDYEYFASRDYYGKFLIKPNYINAGVLLFNMKMAKETGLFEKARAWLRKKKLVFADQSALIRSTTKRKVLSQRFNDQKFLHKKTVIRHFSKRLFWLPYPHIDNIKQWHIDRVHKVFKYHNFDDILNEYVTLKERYGREFKDHE